MIYLVPGAIMDQMAILALTVPIVLPVIEGLNVFIVARATDMPTERVFRGVLPFVVALLLVALLFTFVPQIVLRLPETMSG